MPFIITSYFETRMNYDDLSLEYQVGYSLLETFTRLLKFINNVANFFCYCISGKSFKSELVTMVKGWFRVKDSPAENNSSLSTVTTMIDLCNSRV